MLHGEVRPNIVSWVLWTLIQVIIIAAQIAAGISWAILIPLMMTFNTILVLTLCLRGYGYAKYGWIDAICFAFVILAVVLWRTTNDPVVALACSIAADFLAGVPTYIKVYKLPYSESFAAWAILIMANILALVSIPVWSFGNSIFSFYIVIVLVDTFFIGVMIARRHVVRPS